MSLALRKRDYRTLQATEDFLLKNGLIPHAVDIRAAVDPTLWQDAERLIASRGITVAQIRYVSNAK